MTISAVTVIIFGVCTAINKTTDKNEELTTILHNSLEVNGYGLVFLLGLFMILGTVYVEELYKFKRLK